MRRQLQGRRPRHQPVRTHPQGRPDRLDRVAADCTVPVAATSGVCIAMIRAFLILNLALAAFAPLHPGTPPPATTAEVLANAPADAWRSPDPARPLDRKSVVQGKSVSGTCRFWW